MKYKCFQCGQIQDEPCRFCPSCGSREPLREWRKEKKVFVPTVDAPSAEDHTPLKTHVRVVPVPAAKMEDDGSQFRCVHCGHIQSVPASICMACGAPGDLKKFIPAKPAESSTVSSAVSSAETSKDSGVTPPDAKTKDPLSYGGHLLFGVLFLVLAFIFGGLTELLQAPGNLFYSLLWILPVGCFMAISVGPESFWKSDSVNLNGMLKTFVAHCNTVLAILFFLLCFLFSSWIAMRFAGEKGTVVSWYVPFIILGVMLLLASLTFTGVGQKTVPLGIIALFLVAVIIVILHPLYFIYALLLSVGIMFLSREIIIYFAIVLLWLVLFLLLFPPIFGVNINAVRHMKLDFKSSLFVPYLQEETNASEPIPDMPETTSASDRKASD